MVVVHGLQLSVAHGIFWDQGSGLCPRYWQVGSYPLCHQEAPGTYLFRLFHLLFLERGPQVQGSSSALPVQVFILMEPEMDCQDSNRNEIRRL